jgi:hypothetical protein
MDYREEGSVLINLENSMLGLETRSKTKIGKNAFLMSMLQVSTKTTV